MDRAPSSKYNEIARHIPKASLSKELPILLKVNLLAFQFIRDARGQYQSPFMAKEYYLTARGKKVIQTIQTLDKELFNF
ncbi:MAG TPA: hypothetical protein VMV49_06755 [Candidatus Deferrimicrobium sp.]|nr:hypothetical protein [Candidatus Deferrimicrobium sp.]